MGRSRGGSGGGGGGGGGGGRWRSRRGRGGGRGGSRRNPRILLRGLIGQELSAIEADLIRDQGELDQEPSQLNLRFSDGGEISLLASSDGESIRISRKPCEALPYGERELEVVRRDQSDELQWQPFVGKRCKDVLEVRDLTFGGKGVWCGVEFLFDGDVTLSAYNWGDELLCTAPPEALEFLEHRSVQRRAADGSEGDPDVDEGAPGGEGAPASEGGEGGSRRGSRRRSRRGRGSDEGRDAGGDQDSGRDADEQAYPDSESDSDSDSEERGDDRSRSDEEE